MYDIKRKKLKLKTYNSNEIKITKNKTKNYFGKLHTKFFSDVSKYIFRMDKIYLKNKIIILCIYNIHII